MLRRIACQSRAIAVPRCSIVTSATFTSEAVQSITEPYLDAEEIVQPNRYLSLFPSPKVVVPSFELTRRLGTLISQAIYLLFFEKTYNKEGLVRAANEGISVIGECIANEEWSRMSLIASKTLVEQAQMARKRCTPDQLAMLRLSPDDVILSFIHSAFLSGRDFRNRKAEHGVVSIYFTIASFIRKNSSVPWEATLPQLLGKYRKDVIVANVTEFFVLLYSRSSNNLYRFARTISPLGQWKATGVNFFELDGTRQ
ncbi:unnamed protein product [Strongylus vulgaris]|uniref:Uncharacterized protein n=1 Tax=Strongylus vulgaris TaxID=40348 RepID=A0A3P7II34_STRVU|nr:unnamed protein product [Strongylus vulgaris]